MAAQKGCEPVWRDRRSGRESAAPEAAAVCAEHGGGRLGGDYLPHFLRTEGLLETERCCWSSATHAPGKEAAQADWVVVVSGRVPNRWPGVAELGGLMQSQPPLHTRGHPLSQPQKATPGKAQDRRSTSG